MKTERVHRGTTWALMTFTDGTAQAESHSYPDGTVLEEQTAGTDRQCMQPVATMWCCCSEESCSVLWLGVLVEELVVLKVHCSLVPGPLSVYV